MTLKEKLIYHKNTYRDSRVLISTLLGELDRKSKDPTDAEVVAAIKKMIQNNIECGELGENEILEQFLPQQLSGIKIDAIFSCNDFKNIGECMKFFKENYAGRYDGKVISAKFRALS